MEVAKRFGKNAILVTGAASFAAAGLALNNTTMVIGSMLVSPIGKQLILMVTEALNNDIGNTNTCESAIKIGDARTTTVSRVAARILTLCLYVLTCFVVGVIAAQASKADVIDSDDDGDTYGLKLGSELRSRGDPVHWAFAMVGFAAGVVLVVGDTLPAVGVGVATALLPPLVSSGMYYGYRTATTKADQRQELLSRSHRAMQTFLINCLSIVVGVSVGSFYMKYARSSC